MSELIHSGPVADAASAMAILACAVGRLGVAADDRPEFLACAAHALREHGSGAAMTLGVTDDGRLEAVIGPAGDPERAVTVTVAVPPGPVRAAGSADLAGAVLLDVIIDQHATLDWHRRELEQTNQGVLALHAELDESAERLRHASELQQHLLSAERAARASAEASRARLGFLAHASATLSESLDHEQILDRLRALTVPRYASVLTVWLARAVGSLEPYPAPSAPPQPSQPVEKAYSSGRIQHATSAPAEDEAVVTGVDTTVDARQVLAVPLISRGRTLGVLAAEPATASFSPEDIAVFSELGRITAAATDNALRYEHERDVAERLQRAMLTELPDHGRLEFIARYLPAEAGLNVGGDWYDAFERPDGDVIAAVGDVTGHGLQAAALMGQLRTTLRAYAIDAPGPGEVLTRMHRLLSHLQPDDLATAVLAQMSCDGLLRWANAGHPPPLLRTPDGVVSTLDGHDFLLGMPLEGSVLREHSIRLEPGAAVLFYTDGLIERRGLPLDEGIDRLVAAFAEADGDLDAVADTVLSRMLRDSAREDDTCLLMFGMVPEPEPDDGGGRSRLTVP